MQITLRAARVNAGLTILEASKRLGCGKDTLMKLEKMPEKCTVLMQRKISDVYSMPLDYIDFGQHLESNASI